MLMAIAAVILNSINPQPKPNLLTDIYTLEQASTSYATSAGTGTFLKSDEKPIYGNTSLLVTNTDTPNTDLVFSFTGATGVFNVPYDGNVLLQFAIRNPSYNAAASSGSVKLYNGATLVQTFTFDTGAIYDTVQTFSQIIALSASTAYSLQFVFNKNTTSAVANNYIVMDGLKMEYTENGIPSAYTQPVDFETDYFCILKSPDALTLSLSAGVDTAVTYSAGTPIYKPYQYPSFISNNAGITPDKYNATYAINFTFDTVAPTTDNNPIIVTFVSNSFVVKRWKFFLSSTDAEQETWNVDFNISTPEAGFDGWDLFADGGRFYIKSTAAISVKKPRIEVSRVVRGVTN